MHKRSYGKLKSSILLIFLTATPIFSNAGTSPKCNILFSETPTQYFFELPDVLTSKIMTAGFSAGIAKRIAEDYPNLAEKIIKLGTQATPVILYRGIRVGLEDFDPKYNNYMSADGSEKLIFFTEDVHFASSYAALLAEYRLSKGENQSIILEVELPKSILKFEPLGRGPLGNWMLKASEISDLLPFIRRIGVFSISEIEADPSVLPQARNIEWLSFEQFKNRIKN